MVDFKGFMVPRSGYRQMLIDTSRRIAGDNKMLNTLIDDITYALGGNNEIYSNQQINKNEELNKLFGDKRIDPNEARTKIDKTIYGQQSAPNKLKYTKINKVNPKLLPTTYVQPNHTIYNAKNAQMLKNLRQASTIGKVAKGAGKFATEWVPGISDVADIYNGYRNYQNADTDAKKAIAIAQMMVGVGGLATLGVGSGVKTLGKLAAKGAINRGMARKLIQMGARAEDVNKLKFIKNAPYNTVNFFKKRNDFAKNILYNKWGNPLFAVGSEIAYNLMPSANAGELTPSVREKYGLDNPQSDKSGTSSTDGSTVETTPYSSQPSNVTPTRTGGGGDRISQVLDGLDLTPDERAYLEKGLREYAANGGDINSLFGGGSDVQQPTTATQPQTIQPVEQQPQSNTTISASDRLNNMMNMMRLQQERESYYEPYRRGLRNYLGNYNNMYDSQRASDYALAALSTMPGAENIANVIGKYGALNKEASRLALEKQLADEFAGSQDRQMEAIGNMTMADIVGLDPAVAYGNTKTIDNMLDYDNKRTIEAMKDATKRYGIDERTTLKYYEAQLKDESKRLALAGDWKKALLRYNQALEVAKLNNTGRFQNALVSSAPYYADNDELLNVLQILGRYNPQQSSTTSQPITKSGARANVSVNQATNRQKAISDFVDKNK